MKKNKKEEKRGGEGRQARGGTEKRSKWRARDGSRAYLF